MPYIIIQILAGLCLPTQTSVNTKLRKKIGSPIYPAFWTFLTATAILLIVRRVIEHGETIPFGRLLAEPWWIWIGGVCGVVFVCLNILIYQHIGSVQTVILPALGQTVTGLLIDHFGLFRANVIPMSLMRALGGVMVLAGVLLVTRARVGGSASGEKESGLSLLPWQLAAVGQGVLNAMQTAANGYAGRVLGSGIRGSVVNFLVGLTLITILTAVTFFKNGSKIRFSEEPSRWWMWLGGVCGVSFITCNAIMSTLIGNGMTVVAGLIGSMTGGVLIDQLGLFETPKRPVTAAKIIGIVIMLAGAACIRLL